MERWGENRMKTINIRNDQSWNLKSHSLSESPLVMASKVRVS